MAGHSKWSKVKRFKGAIDTKRGQIFSKFSKEITIAAKTGGGDPNGNPRLRSAIQAARDQSMPNDNIDRAIKRGTGEGVEAANFEEIIYEGYGPGGVAIVCEVLTDNKNRTAGDVRSLFTKSGGSMAATGAVAFLFDRMGVIAVAPGQGEDKVMELALDAGAADVVADGEGGFEVRTDPPQLLAVHKALEGKLPVGAPKLTYLPKSTVKLEGETAEKVLKLVEALEENDDVQHVHANFEMDDSTLASLEARA